MAGRTPSLIWRTLSKLESCTVRKKTPTVSDAKITLLSFCVTVVPFLKNSHLLGRYVF